MAPKVQIKLKSEGSLSKYGYHLTDTRDTRRKALTKVFADRKTRIGLNQLIARINVLSIYFKNKKPLYAARADEDEQFVRKYRDKKYPLK
ncbi:hypothetical protein PBCVNEJV1_553R [Paramecium bursaria Chlorella virus NE-JV-1]|nr:hypothetical protein PBCVNEJV1_553R [Paramecium bursaria Chlorella virus NE-JV-1]